MKLNSWQDWLKIACILLALIIFLIGFLAGYFYSDKSCFEDPLTYGINIINEINDDEFICSCYSISGRTNSFLFGKDGVFEEEMFLGSEQVSWILP